MFQNKKEKKSRKKVHGDVHEVDYDDDDQHHRNNNSNNNNRNENCCCLEK